jgi:hypothetical protein
MDIVETYSHFNGLEYLKVHKVRLWEEIKKVISSVDVNICKAKIYKEKNKVCYSSTVLNNCFKKFLVSLGWEEYGIQKKKRLNRNLLSRHSEEKTNEIKDDDKKFVFNQNMMEFAKERVALEIYFSKYYFESPILFARHLASYVYDQIDVGIEILPMKALQIQMSSGVPYYEGELYNVIRQGRGVPAVPLVIVGIMP